MRLAVVFAREYVQAVRARGFLSTTLLAPLAMLLLASMPALVTRLTARERTIVVVDGTGAVGVQMRAPRGPREPGAFDPRNLFGGGPLRFEMADARAPSVAEAERAARARLYAKDGARVDGVLLVPEGAIDEADLELTLVTRAADPDLAPQVSRAATLGMRAARARRLGLSAEAAEGLAKDVRVAPREPEAESGASRKTGSRAPIGPALGFAFATLLFLPMLVHGQRVMGNLVKEKNDRVMEVVLSSIDEGTLFAGKILAATAVASTQVLVWVAIGVALGRGMMDAASGGLVAAFVGFFVLGQVLYLCLYTIAGAASDALEETGHKLLPVTVATTVQWLLIMPVLLCPDAPFAVVASLVPPLAPATMFVRLLAGPVPAWQIGTSVAGTALSIVVLVRAAAKIFRVGVLRHGRGVTFRELWAWAR